MTHTTGIKTFIWFDTPAAAADAALNSKDFNSEDDQCSLFLLIDSDGDKNWAICTGDAGVHCTIESARDAEAWFEDDWADTTNKSLAE